MYSVDGFHIEIKGKGAHGAYPQNSVDPINIAAHVYFALQSVIARETDPSKACLMTVGKFLILPFSKELFERTIKIPENFWYEE